MIPGRQVGPIPSQDGCTYPAALSRFGEGFGGCDRRVCGADRGSNHVCNVTAFDKDQEVNTDHILRPVQQNRIGCQIEWGGGERDPGLGKGVVRQVFSRVS